MAEIDNLIAEVNKKYKTGIIRRASDLKSVEFIPYTSPQMNYITRGLLPFPRIYCFFIVIYCNFCFVLLCFVSPLHNICKKASLILYNLYEFGGILRKHCTPCARRHSLLRHGILFHGI